MTTALVIRPSVYYDAATALNTAAADLYREVDNRWSLLAAGEHMAGTYDEATKWAESYDQHAYEALRLVSATAQAMDAYATVLRTLGHNHETAEYNATHGDDGDPPGAPPTPPPAVYSCRVPLPSAGGPTNGLDEALKIAEKVGIIVPNGDTGKLGSVADAWTQLQTMEAVANLAAEIQRVAGHFAEIQTPECDYIEADLDKLKAAAESIPAVFGTLATACRDHSTALGDLREKLKTQLEDLAKELAKELAITAAIGIATSFVTFGIGAAVASAKAVEIAARFARPIRAIIDVWKGSKKLENGIKIEQNIAKHSDELRDLEKLGQRTAGKDWLTGGMSTEERWMLTRGPSRDLIRGLREGNLTADQQAEALRINAALDKLPPYQGTVTRHIQMTPEEIARFQPGQAGPVNGFMNSSSRAGNELMANTTNTEFQIVSKTGRQVHDYGGTPDEVMFKTGTEFFCKSKVTDPKTGRTIITLVEP
ncbi:ADP-ribosyltransferase [Nocardia beijingensis]